MVTNIIKSDQFEKDFYNDPEDMLTKLYLNVNVTVESPGWRAEAAKEVNGARKIAFMHANETHGATGNRVHCALRIITAFVNKWVLEMITKACDNKFKCSIRKEKREKDTSAIGYSLLIIPGSKITLFVRHLKGSRTFSGSSEQIDYKYALRKLIECSKNAGKSLEEVKRDLESEAASKVVTDEDGDESSPSMPTDAASDSSGGVSSPARAPFGNGGGRLGGDGGQNDFEIEPESYDKDHSDELGSIFNNVDLSLSGFSWASNSLGERSENAPDAASELRQNTNQRQSLAQAAGIPQANRVSIRNEFCFYFDS